MINAKNLEKIKSSAPKRIAVKALMPITIKVYLLVSFLVGQVTFFSSVLESSKYLTNRFSFNFINFANETGETKATLC